MTLIIIGILLIFVLVCVCYFLFQKIEKMEQTEKENFERISTQCENLKLNNYFYSKQADIKEAENATKKAIDNAGSFDDVLHVVNNIVQNNNDRTKGDSGITSVANKTNVTRSSNN